MTPNRPITMSLPLGLFSTATWSAPLPPFAELTPDSLPLDRELLDMPTIAFGTEGLNDDIYWDDGSL
jgi:hypothetical protein